MKIISWNIGGRRDLWYKLESLRADILLLQEAPAPPAELTGRFTVDQHPWKTEGAKVRAWRTAIVGFPGVDMTCFEPRICTWANENDPVTSMPGTLSAAELALKGEEPVIFISVYAPWEKPLQGSSRIYADASAHRLISDITQFIAGQKISHRLVIAGDWNILYGYGEHGSDHWAERYNSVFNRMDALGFEFMGPQYPDGRQATPWPEELPADSKNVPTFHTNRQTPDTAARQLDFVFASRSIADRITTRACNDPADWGDSDHCPIEINLGV